MMSQPSDIGPTAGREPPGIAHSLIRAIDRFSNMCGWVIAWLIVPLTGIMVVEVISRYVIGASTRWVYDLSYMLTGALFMLGAAYTLRHKGHIRTDFLYNSFSPRWQGIVDSIAYIGFFFPGVAIFMWFGWEGFLRSWALGERALSPWAPPLYPLRAVIPLAALLLIIQGVSELTKSLYAVVKGEWP